MSQELPPLQGEYDDVCPLDAEADALGRLVGGDEDELEDVAVLGYN